jgi:flagellar biosynthetic protein FliO
VSAHPLNVPDGNGLTGPGKLFAAWTGLGCVVSQTIHAASSTPFAAPQQIAPSSATGGFLRVIVALLVVLGAVIAAARLARRMRGLSGGSSSALEVLGQLSLGTRERAVLVRVGERQLLIGVAQGSVRTLHVFDDLVLPPAASGGPATIPSAPSFKALLLKSLGK